jgi:hypothetical protein
MVELEGSKAAVGRPSGIGSGVCSGGAGGRPRRDSQAALLEIEELEWIRYTTELKEIDHAYQPP